MTTILLLSLILQPLALQGRVAIIGSVRGAEGGTITAIRVTLMDDNYRLIRTVLPDASGRFQFRNLSQGVYIVRVETPGTTYEEQTQRVEFQSISRRQGSAGEIVETVDFILRKKRSEPVSRSPEVVFAQPIPDAARKEFERGMNKLEGEKSDQGIESLKKAIEIYPDYYLALELLGREYVKRGELEAAVAVLTHAVEVNRTAPKSLYALGVAHLKLKNTTEAINFFDKVIDQDPQNANVYMMLGIAYGSNGAITKAEEALKKAYEMSGNRIPEVHLYLAGIYNKQEKYSAAVSELEAYLKEEKNIGDPGKIRDMINKLKVKEKAKK